MQQSGEHRIAAPIDKVWRALNDAKVLQACIDGCQSMVKVGDDAFAARIKASIGPVNAVFDASVTLADLDPPHACTLVGSVKGGAAGFGKGEARITLAEDGEATRLRYAAEGSVGGKLAQVGQRLVDGVARKTADQFFARFGAVVGAPEQLSEPAPEPAPGRPVVRPWAIIIALAILAAICLYWLATRR
ncbi:MAG TPA: carbon monoxide dehydrogenase subunit G [Caulobacteraceae bacterium]|nr:carbon monoxide dehydrogenase subunit G [Caulobacteraceae bacterium]